ncbi:UDP-N-acetylmuramate dehydrogenase [Haliea sp. E17]|uniref:UDP-N-acetylmuramate dehydrogenase n=1 Tax=Haliea sp. E17 TaxID=3401576 RepID=UPI003AB0BCED
MQIRRAESLRSFNTLALEARATALVEVAGEAELAEALAWARAEGLPPLPLGEGSNVVFAGDLEALVIHQHAAGWSVLAGDAESVRLRVSAGENWHSLVARSLQQGWYGLENLALIPGTVGAAPVQNIGAYGVELERFVEAVHAVAVESGEKLLLERDACEFGYRDSVFKSRLRDKVIITAVDFRLPRIPAAECRYPALATELEARGVVAPTPQDVFDAVVAVRRRRLPDPAREPNAGSFFKNPLVEAGRADALAAECPGLPRYPQADGRVKLAAAWLIEQAGWKGHREGQFGIHPEHALVMVNYGGDSGEGLLQLAAQVVQSVRERFAVTLEMEPRIYGKRP